MDRKYKNQRGVTMLQKRMFRLVVCGVTVAMCSTMSLAGFIPVIGGPTWLRAEGGFYGDSSQVFPLVNDAGLTVGNTTLYTAQPVRLGARAVQWNGGSGPIPLQLLGADLGGKSFSRVIDMNNAGIAIGQSEAFDASGASKGRRPVRWDAAGHVVELPQLGAS